MPRRKKSSRQLKKLKNRDLNRKLNKKDNASRLKQRPKD